MPEMAIWPFDTLALSVSPYTAMSWILNDIKSLLPSGAPEPAALPELDSPAPQTSVLLASKPTIVAFLRHLGLSRLHRGSARIEPNTSPFSQAVRFVNRLFGR